MTSPNRRRGLAVTMNLVHGFVVGMLRNRRGQGHKVLLKRLGVSNRRTVGGDREGGFTL
jgi:hypothetical protein